MSINDELDFAVLAGAHGDLLSLRLTTDNPNYTSVAACLHLPNLTPDFHQHISTATYALPDIRQLGALLNGNSDVVFALDTLNLRCRIYEHTWGARYAFIASGTITTIQSFEFSPWPAQRDIGDFILDHHSSAACLSFALRCDYEQLQIFHSQLSRILAQL